MLSARESVVAVPASREEAVEASVHLRSQGSLSHQSLIGTKLGRAIAGRQQIPQTPPRGTAWSRLWRASQSEPSARPPARADGRTDCSDENEGVLLLPSLPHISVIPLNCIHKKKNCAHAKNRAQKPSM